MKNISKSKKILLAISILIILAGIIMLVVEGFNKSLIYQNASKIECYIPDGYTKEDIKQITDEVFLGKKVLIQDVEKLSQVVSIKIQEYTQEELDNFKSKISEKYGIEKEDLQVYEIEVPATRVKTIVTPYVWPVAVTTIISIVYLTIKNIKQRDVVKKILKLLLTLALVTGLYFSIIVIVRIPVNEYIMPIALALYVITLLGTVIKLDK